ncbi:hypothetical protein [Rhodoferax fermentans]|uniref:Uncharacterized protein n=1 Tax=Rhodoferax fermentans TaxID=28066 RepID=A0A1T1ARN2_RHOFE|nr:hypothetical protein [Rhodoferax fermentans]MBK1682204.1 hypothetical protein [Rhodoferax fermentans]OOV06772.1 hypothetical protein RF819_08570 [Rhodoferax fermentans]
MSTVNAQRVSLMRDNSTTCRPSDGHLQELEVDLTKYVRVAEHAGELKSNDQVFPFGKPLENVVKAGNSIYEKNGTPKCRFSLTSQIRP